MERFSKSNKGLRYKKLEGVLSGCIFSSTYSVFFGVNVWCRTKHLGLLFFCYVEEKQDKGMRSADLRGTCVSPERLKTSP